MAREKMLGGNQMLGAGKRRYLKPSLIAVALGFAAMSGFAQAPARADDTAQQLQLLEDQIRQLQAQIDSLKKEQMKQAQAAPAKPAAIGANNPAYGYETGGHQFGWTSADGADSIELTGRIHIDAADYMRYRPQLNNATRTLEPFGWDARRIRLGVTGKFFSDWGYTLIGDFGGSSDSVSPYVSGAAASEFENAFITYNGWNKGSFPVAVTVGYIDVPWVMDEATSSNDLLFMEGASAHTIATEFGGGDQRSAIGIVSAQPRVFGGAWLTGPAAGTPHTISTSALGATSAPAQTTVNGEAMAILGRIAGQPYTDAGSNIHVGVDAGWLMNPGATTTLVTGGANVPYASRSLTLSDRPELRVDPTSLLSATISNVQHGWTVGPELAGQFDQFFAQGEYYYYHVDRFTQIGQASIPSVSFDGGYGEVSYAVGGKRKYNPGSAAYTGVIPDHPLSMSEGGGWGAVEFALKYSYVDLNSHVTDPNGIEGGIQTIVGAGINYYANTNVRMMLDYEHINLKKDPSNANGGLFQGSNTDVLAGRFQVAW